MKKLDILYIIFVMVITIAVFKNESITKVIIEGMETLIKIMEVVGEKMKEYSCVEEIIKEDTKRWKEIIKEKGEIAVYCITGYFLIYNGYLFRERRIKRVQKREIENFIELTKIRGVETFKISEIEKQKE